MPSPCCSTAPGSACGSRIIVLLTVVHYHYVGFVLPLVTGLAGRRLAGGDGRHGDDLAGRTGAAATLVIVVNLALIAVGIAFSPLVEGGRGRAVHRGRDGVRAARPRGVAPSLSPLPRALLSVESLTLVVAMSLALAYGYSAFPATGTLISIGETVAYHGSLNAAGFALPSPLAFRLLEKEVRSQPS